VGYRDKCLQEKRDECHICGAVLDIVVHHIDNDPENNALENLLPVCEDCHIAIHRGDDRVREWTEKLKPDEETGRHFIRMRMNPRRETLLEEVKEIFGTTNDTEAIEMALRHTIKYSENLEAMKRDLTPEQAEELSTDEIRLEMYPQVKPRNPYTR
jgi:hypothetical protein